MMDEALIDVTEAEMLVVSLEETPCEAEVAETLAAVEEADGIPVPPVAETEGESLSDSVVVTESGGEVVLVSGVVVMVEADSEAESVSDSEVAENGGEVEVITGVVVVVDATLDGSSVLIIEDDVVSGIEEVESVDEGPSGALDVGGDGEANVVVDEEVSDVDSEDGVENELLEADPVD
jgi:hypothetical protein